MSDSIKLQIRKRLFMAAKAKGTSGSAYGIKWCSHCQGRGAICIEHHSGDRVAPAAMETCNVCKGEKLQKVE